MVTWLGELATWTTAENNFGLLVIGLWIRIGTTDRSEPAGIDDIYSYSYTVKTIL